MLSTPRTAATVSGTVPLMTLTTVYVSLKSRSLPESIALLLTASLFTLSFSFSRSMSLMWSAESVWLVTKIMAFKIISNALVTLPPRFLVITTGTASALVVTTMLTIALAGYMPLRWSTASLWSSLLMLIIVSTASITFSWSMSAIRSPTTKSPRLIMLPTSFVSVTDMSVTLTTRFTVPS